MAAAATLVVLAFLLAAGSLRYGGPEALFLRVRAEVAAGKPHPQLVPTPMPTPTGGAALALIIPTPEETEPLAFPTPTPVAAPATSLQEPRGAANSQREDTALEDRPLVVPSDVPDHFTATPTASPVPVPTAAPLPAPVANLDQPTLQLEGLSHYWQTWNNCGPATLAMNLSYFGSQVSQKDTAAVLKPDSNDKNVSPDEMVAYARSQGYGALARVNGDGDRLRALLNAGIPVLIETWLDHDGGMGHYRLATGYDDDRREWIVYDSYISQGVDPDKPYPGIRVAYDKLASLWRVFNGTYVVVYDEARAPLVAQVLGEDMDDGAMWQRSLARAQADLQADPNDAFNWFNLGSNLVAQGRYEEAASAFDQARVIGLPWRMLWYQFGPFQAYYQTGRYDELVAVADATIATAGNVEETFYWRGVGLQALGDQEGARQAFQRAVELNPNYAEAAAALAALAGS